MEKIKAAVSAVAGGWRNASAWIKDHPNVTLALDVILIVLLVLSLIKV